MYGTIGYHRDVRAHAWRHSLPSLSSRTCCSPMQEQQWSRSLASLETVATGQLRLVILYLNAMSRVGVSWMRTSQKARGLGSEWEGVQNSSPVIMFYVLTGGMTFECFDAAFSFFFFNLK